MGSAPLAIIDDPKCTNHREPQNQPAAGQEAWPEAAVDRSSTGGYWAQGWRSWTCIRNHGKSTVGGSSWSNNSGFLHYLIISDRRWKYPREASHKSHGLWFSPFSLLCYNGKLQLMLPRAMK